MPTAIINEDPFCDVEMYSLKDSGLSNKYVVRLRDQDTEQMVPIDTKGAIHGESYRLVPNSRVNQMTQDVLTRTGLDWQPLPKYNNSKVSDQEWDGKKFAARFFIPDISAQFNDGDIDTELMLGVEALNSYDGSYGVSLQFFAMSLTCANQFRSHNLLGGFNFRHHEKEGQSLEADMEDASKMLMSQAERFKTILPKVERLRSSTLQDVYGCGDTMDAFLAMRKSMNKIWRPTYDSHLLDELGHRGVTSRMGRHQTSHCRNMWGVLNAFTAVATHHIGGFNGANTNRMVTDHFMNAVSVGD